MSRSYAKKLFLDSGVARKCVLCGLGESWNNLPMVLELDHIDGNNTNDDFQNLRLLCPNCHSQQPTSNRTKGRSKMEVRKIGHEAVLDLAAQGKNTRQILLSMGFSDTGANYLVIRKILRVHGVKYPERIKLSFSCDGRTIGGPRPLQRKANWPTRTELQAMTETMSGLAIGRKYGVTSNAVAKWCKLYCIPTKPRGYWAKFHAIVPEGTLGKFPKLVSQDIGGSSPSDSTNL